MPDDIMLYPQFKPVQYNVILDYQGSSVVGKREFTINYGESITSLPEGLSLEDKTFKGWYTKPDKKGIQIASAFYVFPEKSTITSKNFDLSDPDRNIYLYAGFCGKMHTLSLYCDNEECQEIEYEHGQIIEDLIYKYNDKVIDKWTTVKNDRNYIFNRLGKSFFLESIKF